MLRFILVATICLTSLCSVTAAVPAAPFQFKAKGSLTDRTVVDASADLQSWTPLVTNNIGATNVTVTDTQSPNFARRFYRERVLPGALAALEPLTNSVFVAGEGFSALQTAPSGKVGMLFWRGRDLVYRERVSGSWTERVLGNYGANYIAGATEEYRFQPHAALLFDSQSRAQVLRISGTTLFRHVQQSNGTFADGTSISLGSVGSSFSLFAAAMGPSDKLHIAVVPSTSSPTVSYGTDKSGTWQWSSVTTITGNARGFLRQSYAPRWFSMAVDAQNKAHLVFCPQFVMGQSPEGYLRPYSELHYATDRTGSWTTERISFAADGSGDVGAGASIAIGADNQPAIASWYNERAGTGSSQFSHLNFFRRTVAGLWIQQSVAQYANGYEAGDGDRGAGFAPLLRFDAQGRPHIAFCDDASQHFSSSGQNEYAGNLRHAFWNGTQWTIQTVYQQTAALDRQIVYPTMTIAGNEMVFIGVERRTIWQQPDYRVAASTYNFFMTTRPLP